MRRFLFSEWMLLAYTLPFLFFAIDAEYGTTAKAIDLPPGEQVGPRPPDYVVAQTEQPKLRETDWSKRIAADFRAQGTPAETEFVCPDGSRVDVLTPDYAYEVEWGHSGKFKEAIGQAVLYGILTNRPPGIILLVDDKSQVDYLRCAVVCGKLGIRLETRSVK